MMQKYLLTATEPVVLKRKKGQLKRIDPSKKH